MGGRGSLDGWSCCGLRRPSAEGLAWPAPLSHRPTLRRFWVQGDSPCTPGGGCAPCTLLGGRDGGSIFSPSAGRQGRGQDASAGRMVLLRLAPSFSGGDWLGLRRCPTGPPSDVFRDRGTPPVPPAGLRPCTLLGDGVRRSQGKRDRDRCEARSSTVTAR